ncbi:MAG: antibiotic biosynthesis monooxygenase [Sutterella wadsworthensis]|uniref:antibiotic biosynthesis monooxygenase family protein n=1 Tax=Sutterella wadsworthensis TaxID=40545 RepID=UPI00307E4EEE|nr:antibiotic biosynthesis monooxygenase [Sutterella wadsworthensis]
MSVVLLFEAQVQPGRLEAYVHYALEAQRDLATADGCLSTEQLMAVDEARRIMVKSIWRDSASAQEWNRTNGALLAERAARLSLFEDYSVSLLCPAEFTPTAAPVLTIRESAAIAS